MPGLKTQRPLWSGPVQWFQGSFRVWLFTSHLLPEPSEGHYSALRAPGDHRNAHKLYCVRQQKSCPHESHTLVLVRLKEAFSRSTCPEVKEDKCRETGVQVLLENTPSVFLVALKCHDNLSRLQHTEGPLDTSPHTTLGKELHTLSCKLRLPDSGLCNKGETFQRRWEGN